MMFSESRWRFISHIFPHCIAGLEVQGVWGIYLGIKELSQGDDLSTLLENVVVISGLILTTANSL
jgi:hypothetical protein